MGCIIMRGKAILLFLINYIAISLSTDKEEEKFEKFNFLNKTCPNLLKIIEVNEIEAFATNCKTSLDKNFKINEENILKNTCQVVEYVIGLICKSQYFQQASQYLNLKLNNPHICPFNFSLLPSFDNSQFAPINIVDLLSNETICSKTCYDINEPKNQCVVLHNALEYLKIIKKHRQNFFKNYNNQTYLNSTNAQTVKPLNFGKKKFLLNLNYSIEGEEKENRKYVDHHLEQSSETEIYKNTFANKTVLNSKIPLSSKSVEKNNKITSEVFDQKSSGYSEEPVLKVSLSSATKEIKHIKMAEQILVPSEIPFKNLLTENQLYPREKLLETEESHFFFYFLMLLIFVIVGYIAVHNKNKILAFALEGKNNRHHRRRRSNSIRYKKLESNLEEVITSDLPCTTSSIVY